MFCPRCGAEVKTSGAFCGKCGAALPGRAPKAPLPRPVSAKKPRWPWILCALAVCLALAAGALFLLPRRTDAPAAPAEDSSAPETAAPAETPAPTSAPVPTPEPLPEKDPFERLTLSFSGVSGAGSAALSLADETLDPEDFSVEPMRGLSNGDTVTVRFPAREGLSFRPGRTEAEYTVSGLAEYIRSLSGLSPAALEALRDDARARLGAEAVEAGMAFTGGKADNELAVLWAVPGARALDGPEYSALWYRGVTDAPDAPETAEKAPPEPVPDPYAWFAERSGAETDEALRYYQRSDGWVRGLSDLSPAALEALRTDACAAVRASLEGEYTVTAARTLGECFVKNNDPEAAPEDAGVVAVVVEALVTDRGAARTLYVPAGYAMVFVTREGCRCGLELGALEQEGIPVRFGDLRSMYRALRFTVGILYDFELSPELERALNAAR